MPKHLTKISKFGGQYRLTIPKGLIQEMDWQDVEFVLMDKVGHGALRIRRFIDGQSLKSKAAGHKAGCDR